MKVVFYLLLSFLFIACLILGYVDYNHLQTDYKLEAKIQRINNKNVQMLKKINNFCLEFTKNKKEVGKK